MSFHRLVFLALFWGCTVGTVASQSGDPVDYQVIAARYAPVLYQEAHSFKLDQVTRFDYDGDWNGANNWNNAYLFPSPGYVYYAVIEGDRHYFLYYAFYHMRDYTSRVLESYAPKIEHENDMEGMVLVVPKEGGAIPRPIYMETLAHDHFYKYIADSKDAVGARIGKLDGSITWEEGYSLKEPYHPQVFIESEGHGVFSLRDRFSGTADKFPGFVYRLAGRPAEEPEEIGDIDVSYQLLPIRSHLWNRRLEIGKDRTYCCSSEYQIAGGKMIRVGSAFNGPLGACSAKPPWGWDQRDDGDVRPGEWFLNPIYALGTHVDIPDFSRKYRDNPYFTDTESFQEGEDCLSGFGGSASVAQSTLETIAGIGQVLLSGGMNPKNMGDKARGMFLKNLDFLEWSSSSEMARWLYLDKSDKPVFQAKTIEGRHYRTRLEVQDMVQLVSPLFEAPGAYYREMVFRYRVDQPLECRLEWQYSDQSVFSDTQAGDMSMLIASRDWKVFHLPLANLKNLLTDRNISRWRIRFSARIPGTLLEIQYIAFDRTILSDTFRKRNP